MFRRIKSREQIKLEIEISRVIGVLQMQQPGTQEYAKTLHDLSELHKMKEEEKSPIVSKDTLAIVGANLLGILLIIQHENVNVITTRAMNLLMTPRLPRA